MAPQAMKMKASVMVFLLRLGDDCEDISKKLSGATFFGAERGKHAFFIEESPQSAVFFFLKVRGCAFEEVRASLEDVLNRQKRRKRHGSRFSDLTGHHCTSLGPMNGRKRRNLPVRSTPNSVSETHSLPVYLAANLAG